MQFKIVTTCNKSGWNTYGRKMVETFLELWPKDVELWLYNEGFDAPVNDRIVPRDFPKWHYDFKERHRDNPAAHGNDRKVNRKGRAHDYRYDCVRFSHKVAAITDAAFEINSGVLIWIDADTLTHDTVSKDWLNDLFPGKPVQPGIETPYIAWLQRENKYPECGFMMFRCNHGAHKFFMCNLVDKYKYDTVFDYKETHDSYVIEQLITHFHNRDVIGQPFDLSGPRARRSSHPFVLSRLGEKLDHLKGNIKHKEKKTPKFYVAGRNEDYWT